MIHPRCQARQSHLSIGLMQILVYGKADTRFIHFDNTASITWCSKKENKTETTTHEAEFYAGRTRIKQVVEFPLD